MSKHWRFVLILVALSLFALPFSASAQTGERFEVQTDRLNARTGPGIEFPVVAQLGRGGVYDVLAYSPTRNWIQIDLGFTTAWVFRHLGTVTSPSGVVTTGNVVTTTTTNTANLGQGGGGGAPATTTTTVVVTTVGTQTIEDFNSTIGVLGNLYVRTGPDTSFRPLTIIPLGGRATPIGRNAGGSWIQVDYQGTVGWVFATFVAAPPAVNLSALPVTG